MVKMVETQELLETVIDDFSGIGNAAKVILFNDEWHTFDEVIEQIMKAIKCSFEVAESKTMEVHTKGKSVVFVGDLQECLGVSAVLEEIALHTQVEY
jgi:ATP-dependent Clp protease adaptor protein ClpS